MIMLMIMTGALVAYASLGAASRDQETRREQAVIAKLAFDGATLKAAYDCGLANISYPSTQTETVGTRSCQVTIADNSANLGHSLQMSSTMAIHGRTYTDSRVTALKMPASQFFYCLATNTATSLGSNIFTGTSGANGDVYCTGSLNLAAGDTINGDVEATGTATQGSAVVTGLVSSNTLPIPLPTPNASNYSAVASSSLLNLLLGILLSGETFTSPYMVIYCDGDTKINGVFTGKGVVFVNGNVTINGNMSYLLPSDEVAVIVTGNVTVQSSSTAFCGYWYCGGTFSVSSNSSLTRGCIATNALTTSGPFTATYDPIIWNTPGEAARLKLPGFWP